MGNKERPRRTESETRQTDRGETKREEE